MNLNLTSTIKMPDHALRRQVIELCNKTGKPVLKLSTKDYEENGLGHLVEQFDGFTYYPNTISLGHSTNNAAPSLFGGYEYSPANLNKRADELLVDKHNEALKVLPTIFSDNGWKVSVGDPPYANYERLSDVSIYDDIPNVNAFLMDGYFASEEEKEIAAHLLERSRQRRMLDCVIV